MVAHHHREFKDHRSKRISLVVGASLVAFTLVASFSSASATESMTTVQRNLADEEANRALVTKFYNDFFNKHDLNAASVVADDYIQHSPDVADGKQAIVSFFGGYFKDSPNSKAEIVRTAVDGDLVYLHVHETNGETDRGHAVMDIFRVHNG